MADVLTPSFGLREFHTFPTPSAPVRYYPQMQLDHGFHSESLDVRAAEALPMKGSDHYPIYFVIQ